MVWLITLLMLVHAYPLARWLVRTSDRLVLALTTLALSAGSLSLIMLFFGLINLKLTWQPVALGCVVVSGIGFLLFCQDQTVALQRIPPLNPLEKFISSILVGFLLLWRPRSFDEVKSKPSSPLTTLEKLAVFVTAIISILIIFNSIYWPFGIDDSVGIYAYWAKQIYQSGALPPLDKNSLYEAYPMLVPLWMAFTHSAAGWVDEYVAGLIPALLSVACFGAAYLIGRELHDRRIGIIAALLCALMPAVTFWAGAGYTDLPCAFFYGMAGYFLWRAREHWRYALLAGIMAGLAAWTKNSGLLIVGSIGLWWAIRLVRGGERPTVREIVLIAAGFIAVAASWYLRNELFAGYLLPPTGWTYAAQRTLPNLFPFLISVRYLPVGIVLTIGIIYTILRASVKREALYLTVFYVPFFVVWWLLFSYDPRFLLVVLPFVAVMGAQVLIAGYAWITARSIRFPGWAFAGVVLVLAVLSGSTAIDHKSEMLRKPFMNDAEKHVVRLGDRYPVGQYLQQFPGARVWTQDPIMAYHADGVIVQSSPYPADRAALNGFDFWIASPGDAVLDGLPPPITTIGGYRVFRLK